MSGYILILAFGIFFITLALFVSKRFPAETVDDFLVAGRRLPFGLISASVMVSWIWTTTLLGSAESGMWYGIGGGIAFAIGSFIPFFIFIPIVFRMKKIMPHGTTFTELLGQRYGPKLQKVLFIFAIGVGLYISVEQMVGISYAISLNYGIPYKVIVVAITSIITAYIAIAGMQGSVFNDMIQFLIISFVAFILLPLVLRNFGIENLYQGLADVVRNVDNPNHNPWALTLFSPASIRYLIICIVISLGFVLMDQGYYSKALSTINSKTLLAAYLVGTVLAWAPLPILFGTILGGTGLAMELVPGGGAISITSEVAAYVFGNQLPGIGSLMFSLMVFMAGMTTAGNALVGLQALFIVDLQEKMLKQQNLTDYEKNMFGRKMTIGFGIVVAILAVLLEGVSLLYIDIMSGIIFAAPLGSFIMGMYWNKPNEKLALFSIGMGLIGGISIYFIVKDPNVDYFYGNVTALLLPVVILVLGSLFIKEPFDFSKMSGYRSSHITENNENGVKI